MELTTKWLLNLNEINWQYGQVAGSTIIVLESIKIVDKSKAKIDKQKFKN